MIIGLRINKLICIDKIKCYLNFYPKSNTQNKFYHLEVNIIIGVLILQSIRTKKAIP